MVSVKFCAAIATLLVIVALDIGEARVLQPARMLDDPADSMFDLRSSDEKLIESTLDNLDTNQLLVRPQTFLSTLVFELKLVNIHTRIVDSLRFSLLRLARRFEPVWCFAPLICRYCAMK